MSDKTEGELRARLAELNKTPLTPSPNRERAAIARELAARAAR